MKVRTNTTGAHANLLLEAESRKEEELLYTLYNDGIMRSYAGNGNRAFEKHFGNNAKGVVSRGRLILGLRNAG